MNSVGLLLAIVVNCWLSQGTVDRPAAVFPLKPGEIPKAFSWTERGLAIDSRLIPWSELKVEPREGASFNWTGVCSDGEEVVVRVVLKSSASRYRIPSHEGFRKCRADGAITVEAASDGVIKFRMMCRGPRSPILRQFKQVTCTAGARQTIDITGKTTDIAQVWYELFDVDGKPVFSAQGWEIRGDSLVFALRNLHVDAERQILYVRSDNWFGQDSSHELKVAFLDFDTGALVWKARVPALPYENSGYHTADGRREQPVDISSLPPGRFKCVVTLIDGTGKNVATDYLYFAKPDGKAVWEGTSYGMDDTVPPPWTEPTFSDESFTCWNRQIGIGGSGLIGSIYVSGDEILARPVRILLDGKPLTFDAKLIRKSVSEADYELLARETKQISARLRCEFDGYMRFDLTWQPPVRTLELKTAMRRDLVIGFDDCTSAKDKLELGRGKRCSLDLNPDDKSFWWMGSPRAGLMGGFDDLRGWRLKNNPKGCHLEVTDSMAEMTLRLVDTPISEGRARTLSFYLEPTPVKPKNLSLSACPPEKLDFWTQGVERFFEDKSPGGIIEKKFAPFRRDVRNGHRVFYYNGSHGVSTSFPWWGWFGEKWNIHDNAEIYSEEVPFSDRETKDSESWVCACLSDRSFLDYKVWSICWYLWNPDLEIKDLYFDLAGPLCCNSQSHGCRWVDEFGHERNRRDHSELRELHKRVYRELKKKNPDGAMMGHLTRSRTPSDVFFDALVMGECYDIDVCYSLTYYDVLKPETMRLAYASRSNELMILMLPQFRRAMQMYAPDKLKSYDPKTPENDRAIRHALAYFKIHDLGVSKYNSGGRWLTVDQLLSAKMGSRRKFSAYYTDLCPVSVSSPNDRFLYAIYEGDDCKLLIILNDTDKTMSERIVVAGLCAEGRDVFSDEKFSFGPNGCAVSLSARESRFIFFEGSSRK